MEYERRSGAGSLTFCSGKGRGRVAEEARNELATKGHKEHKERRLFLCVLCVPLWQWRFGASLLPGFAKSEGNGGRNYTSR
jgi:hypothetical protein